MTQWRVTNLNIPLTNRVKSDIVISLSKNLQKRGCPSVEPCLSCLFRVSPPKFLSRSRVVFEDRTHACRKTCEETHAVCSLISWEGFKTDQTRLPADQTNCASVNPCQSTSCMLYPAASSWRIGSFYCEASPKGIHIQSLHCKMNFSYLIKHSLAAWRCSNPRFSTTPSSSHQQLAGSPPHRAPRVHWCFFSDLFFGTHPSAVIFLSLGPGVVPLLLSKLGLGGPGTWWCRMFGWFAACCNVWFMLNMLKVWRLEVSMNCHK